jgi:mycothiol synthase
VNLRRPTEADVPAVTELIRAVETDFVGEPEQSEQDLRDDWAELDLKRDAWLVEANGRLVGYASLDTTAHPLADGYVHPDFRGHGIGAQLVELTETEARARSLPKLQNPTFAVDERAHELLRTRGYKEVRRYYKMEIELDTPPEPPDWPPGLTIAADPTELDRFHAALDEAFAEEWGHEPEDGVDWKSVRERRHPDRSLWFAVNDGDEIAAAAIVDEERWGAGWISAVGVRRPWRRRGLGHALLVHCFRELHRRGRQKIALGVDTENPTGATRLYERAGMHVAFSVVWFEKAL